MRSRFVAAAAVLVAAGSLAALLPASAQAHPIRPAAYRGTEYDLGGASHSVSGPQPGVDALADSITASTDGMLRDLAARRSTLPYSRPDAASPLGRPSVVTYPRPDGQAASDQYATSVWQLGRLHDSPVYTVAARRPGNREDDTSWTSFSFNAAIVVAVRTLARSATGCLVRPAAAGIRTWFLGDTCYFAMLRPANLSVEFMPDTTTPVLHPMLVFANPPERDVPAPDDPNVLYFGPGVHHLGPNVTLHSNETIYLAGGAWVEGAFLGLDVNNVVIKGRGVIDGLFMDTGDQTQNKQQPGLIDIRCDTAGDPARTCATDPTSSNVLIDGITLVDAPRFNVRVLSDDATIRNVKIISWWINTDGIVAGNKSLVEGNFVKDNEDSLKLFWGDSVVRDNVVWQLENGAPFMLSWNIEQNSSNFHVYDNDVIHVEQYNAPTQGVFDARHAGAGNLNRYLFDNIRIEDAKYRLFYLNVEHNTWYDPTLGYGSFAHMIFRNITAPASFQLPSVMTGIDAQHGFSDVDLVDVRMGDTCITDAAEADLQLDPEATDQIRVLATPHCGGRS